MIERRLVSRPVSTLGTLIAPNRTQQLGPPIVSQGLIGYWDAGNPYSYISSGTSWKDLSGLASAGTLTNGPSYSFDRGGTITTDGSDDEINFGDTCDSANNATVCVMARIKTLPATTTFGTIIFKYQASPARANYLINVNNTAIQAGYNTSGTFRLLQTAQSNGGITADKWILFGATFEQATTTTNIALWTNGVQFASANRLDNLAANTGDLTLGRVVGIEPLNCEYAVLAIYSRALSSAEMLQNFQSLRGRFNI